MKKKRYRWEPYGSQWEDAYVIIAPNNRNIAEAYTKSMARRIVRLLIKASEEKA